MLTKKRALEITIMLWEAIAENPQSSKQQELYTLFKTRKISHLEHKMITDQCYCPCCAYVAQQMGDLKTNYRDSKRFCPLIEFWLSYYFEEEKLINHYIERRFSLCEITDSKYSTPWQDWTYYLLTDEDLSRAAKEIADGAKVALNKLLNK